MTRLITVITALITIGPSLVTAQTLADVARAEEARRKTVQKTAKVYTNGDLKADFTTPPAPATPPPSMTGAVPVASEAEGAAATTRETVAAPPAAATAAAAAPSPQRDQAYWSARINAARGQLDRSRLFADALQTRINSLSADFVSRDDPAQRAQIEQERSKALGELERSKKDADDQAKAITAIEDEARRAGVPPGWLR